MEFLLDVSKTIDSRAVSEGGERSQEDKSREATGSSYFGGVVVGVGLRWGRDGILTE